MVLSGDFSLVHLLFLEDGVLEMEVFMTAEEAGRHYHISMEKIIRL